MPYDPDAYQAKKRDHICKACPDQADFTFDKEGRVRWLTMCVHCAKRNQAQIKKRHAEQRKNLKILKMTLLKKPLDTKAVVAAARALCRMRS